MPTKYDVFAEVIEQAPCKAKDLKFKTRIYNHLNALVSNNWIKLVDDKYLPIKSDETTAAFNIIKYCLKNGLDYNKFFSKNIISIIKELFSNPHNLRPENLKGNKENVELLAGQRRVKSYKIPVYVSFKKKAKKRIGAKTSTISKHIGFA